MFSRNKVCVLIPARGGSKGLPRKNLCNLGGLSLIEVTAIQASSIFEKCNVYVSSEDTEILQHAKEAGLKTIVRPPELATDDAKGIDVIRHALPKMDAPYIAYMQPDNPFRIISKLRATIPEVMKRGFESAFTAYQFPGFIYQKDGKPINREEGVRPNRQDKEDLIIEDGAMYLFNHEIANKPDYFWGKPFILPGFNGIDIHTLDDLRIANIMWSEWWLR